ncbi:MAG: glycerol-3-phosphate dehydrogenase/oxidase [Chloroflexi bacterium]|nr:glycerol-3-phosphate dehydrogenase/oxidase [Chloroflexota bacterium]
MATLPTVRAARPLDVIVIGGGIIGCAIARDAALRGLRVALVEQADYGGGTSAASTRLVHGGLRYLEQLDFGLVRQDLAERERLLHLAPHLVRPLLFLVPIYGRGALYQAKLRAGMVLYDLLSYDRSLPGHRFLSTAETLAAEPGLAPDGLEGAAVYSDAQIELAERLCIEHVVGAVDAGALALTYTRVTDLLRDSDGGVTGVRVVDQLTDRAEELRAPVTINATGPWLDALLSTLDPTHRPLLRRTKGVHLVTPPATRQAVVLFAGADERLFFVIPWLGLALVGTTDTDFEGDPADARAEPADIAYLVDAVSQAFPHGPWRQIHYTMAGVRALVRREGVSTGAVSRKHRLLDHASAGHPGLISVVGGKLTAHRDIAEEAVNAACARLGVRAPARTRTRPLPGGVGFGPVLPATARRQGLALGLDADQCDHLVRVYGSRYVEVYDLIADRPALAARLDPAAPDCLAQVHHAVQREGARRLTDVLRRRTTLGFSPGQGLAAADRAAAALAEALGRDEATAAAEAVAYRRMVNDR